MSKINFVSLGGCQECGKNLYIVEVDTKIFVLDCGIKYPTSELYGVDYISPDLTYLEQRKKDIVGLFLTHGHEEAMGAVTDFVTKFPDVKIFASHFTLALVQDLLKSKGFDNSKLHFVEVNSKTIYKISNTNNVSVTFLNTAHNIYDSYGIIIHTQDGAIVYTSNFTFDQNQHQADYLSMFSALVRASREGVLALLPEAQGSLYEGSRGTILEFKQRIENIFVKSDGRLIFSLFSNDLQRIQQIIDIANSFNRNIAILGRKTQRTIDVGINMGYLRVPEDRLVNLKFLDDNNKNDDANLVVLVTGERHEPYYMLQRMANKRDRLININDRDNIVILTNPYPGTEKMAARTLDMIYRVCTNVTTFTQDLLPESHANREELKMMINLLHPKYILPVQGEYRHQYACIQIANCVGFDTVNNLIIPDNGDLYNFTDGVLTGVKGSVPVGEIMNDGDVAGDVGQVVMRDRELLGESGVILLYSNINPRTKKVITPLQIVCKGFAYITEHPEFNEKITKAFETVCEKYLQQARIDWSEFKSDIRNAVSRMVYKEANASPIIIPVLISTDPSHLLKPVINMDQTKKAASKKVALKSEKKVVKKDSKKESKESTTPKTKEVKKTVKKVVKKEEKTSEKPKTVKKTVRKVVKKDSPTTTLK